MNILVLWKNEMKVGLGYVRNWKKKKIEIIKDNKINLENEKVDFILYSITVEICNIRMSFWWIFTVFFWPRGENGTNVIPWHTEIFRLLSTLKHLFHLLCHKGLKNDSFSTYIWSHLRKLTLGLPQRTLGHEGNVSLGTSTTANTRW